MNFTQVPSLKNMGRNSDIQDPFTAGGGGRRRLIGGGFGGAAGGQV